METFEQFLGRAPVEPAPAADPADRVTLDGTPNRSWSGGRSAAHRSWSGLSVSSTPAGCARTPRVPVSPAEHRRAVERFLAAAAGGDLSALVAVLDPDVVLTSDGGGVVNAARWPVVGADRVARFLPGISAKVPTGARVVLLDLNGAAGIGVLEAGRLTSVTVEAGRVARVDLVRAPAKLAAFDGAPG